MGAIAEAVGEDESERSQLRAAPGWVGIRTPGWSRCCNGREAKGECALDTREQQSFPGECGPHGHVPPPGQGHKGLKSIPLDVTIQQSLVMW